MFTINTYNKIGQAGLDMYNKDKYVITDVLDNPDAIMVHSAPLHNVDMGKNLKAIVRVGAGVNTIPVDRLTEEGVVVFNTPGANANAVKELVLTSLFLGSRKIISAIDWVNTLKGKGEEVSKLVEKGKSNFAGVEIKGKTLGVIGLGAIGALVANAAIDLGMNVVGYDPFLSVNNALKLSSQIKIVNELNDLCKKSDYFPRRRFFGYFLFARQSDGNGCGTDPRCDLCNVFE